MPKPPVAAAAADRFRQYADRAVLGGLDLCGVRHLHRRCIATDGGVAAHPVREARTAGADRGTDGKPARPAAAAHRFRKDAGGVEPVCRDRVEVLYGDRRSGAAGAGVAATDFRAGVAIQRQRAANGKAAIAAAAADRLGVDAVGHCTSRRDLAAGIVFDRDRARGAGGPAAPADRVGDTHRR